MLTNRKAIAIIDRDHVLMSTGRVVTPPTAARLFSPLSPSRSTPRRSIASSQPSSRGLFSLPFGASAPRAASTSATEIASTIGSADLCVVPTVHFQRLFAFIIIGHGRRQLVWFAVTRHPTAEWLAQQIVEAFPWEMAPTYLVRDNDGAYGPVFTRRVRAMGIRDRPISLRSPWQNPYAERLIGTLRRDCLDHVLVFGAGHLQRILTAYTH